MKDVYHLLEMAQSGDTEARSRLIIENSNLIWSIVKRFSNRGYDAEDLFQIGAIGLIKSIDRFDLSYDVKFSTYATPLIIGEIKRFLRDDGPIKISRSIKSLSFKIKAYTSSFLSKNGISPTIKEISQALEIDESEVLSAMESTYEIESIYKNINTSDGKEVNILEIIPYENKDNDEIFILREAVKSLDDDERRIIIERYFKGKTQSEVGKLLSMSQVQVSRKEKRILQNIKEKLI